MARDTQLHQRRKQKIVAYFQKLDKMLEFGVKKHTTVWCLNQTADHFDLKPKTVEGYVYGKNQMSYS
jgi:hypothetical protein